MLFYIMNKIIHFFCLITISVFGQESNNAILEKTMLQLNKIESIFYQSTLESADSGITYIESDASIFFDFTNTSALPKYFIKTNESELIYNGKQHIQSLSKEKLIVTNESPNAINPLVLTLFSLKVLLPKMMYNTDIIITKKKDTVINNELNYLFELVCKNGYIDWQKLVLKNVPEIETKYILTIKKSNFLPSKMIMPNGSSGTMSRTFDNFIFDYKPDKNTWTGSLLPTEYDKITFNEYLKIMQAKISSPKDNSKNSLNSKNIETWKLPNVINNSTVDFSLFKGNVILLEFWFKFCGPCVQAVPKLNAMHQKYKGDKFKLFGIEFREDFHQGNLIQYIEKIKMNYPILYKGKKMAAHYGIASAPTFIIINKNGDIIYAESGFNEKEITQLIEKNL